jgi:hypothetical protein
MLKSESFNVYTTDLGEEGIDLGKIYDYDMRGIYTLSEAGKAALVRWRAHLPDHGDGQQNTSPRVRANAINATIPG